MEIKSKFDHFNINVTNLERSIAFYEKALAGKNIIGKSRPTALSLWSI